MEALSRQHPPPSYDFWLGAPLQHMRRYLVGSLTVTIVAGREAKFKEDGQWWDITEFNPGQSNDTLRELASIHRYSPPHHPHPHPHPPALPYPAVYASGPQKKAILSNHHLWRNLRESSKCICVCVCNNKPRIQNLRAQMSQGAGTLKAIQFAAQVRFDPGVLTSGAQAAHAYLQGSHREAATGTGLRRLPYLEARIGTAWFLREATLHDNRKFQVQPSVPHPHPHPLETPTSLAKEQGTCVCDRAGTPPPSPTILREL